MKALNHVLLVGNAQTLPADFLQQAAKEADFVLAADGGADRALSCGVRPDAVIGDMDSVSKTAKRQLADVCWLPVDRQDNTDLEKALDYLIQHGCKRCTLCGFFGGSFDFSLGNFMSLTPFAAKLELVVRGPGWQLRPVINRLVLPCSPQKCVSLLTLQTCRNVRTTGLKYPINGETVLPKNAGRYLRNKTTGKRFSVAVTNGLLWVYLED